MITIELDGSVRFRVYLPEAGRVDVVGDFTGWRQAPVALERARGGWWEGVIRVPPGDRCFQYLVDGETWLPDFAAHGVEVNRFGSWTSLLRIEACSSSSVAPIGERQGELKPSETAGVFTLFDDLCASVTWQAAQSA